MKQILHWADILSKKLKTHNEAIYLALSWYFKKILY